MKQLAQVYREIAVYLDPWEELPLHNLLKITTIKEGVRVNVPQILRRPAQGSIIADSKAKEEPKTVWQIFSKDESPGDNLKWPHAKSYPIFPPTLALPGSVPHDRAVWTDFYSLLLRLAREGNTDAVIWYLELVRSVRVALAKKGGKGRNLKQVKNYEMGSYFAPLSSFSWNPVSMRWARDHMGGNVASVGYISDLDIIEMEALLVIKREGKVDMKRWRSGFPPERKEVKKSGRGRTKSSGRMLTTDEWASLIRERRATEEKKNRVFKDDYVLIERETLQLSRLGVLAARYGMLDVLASILEYLPFESPFKKELVWLGTKGLRFIQQRGEKVQWSRSAVDSLGGRTSLSIPTMGLLLPKADADMYQGLLFHVYNHDSEALDAAIKLGVDVLERVSFNDPMDKLVNISVAEAIFFSGWRSRYGLIVGTRGEEEPDGPLRLLVKCLDLGLFDQALWILGQKWGAGKTVPAHHWVSNEVNVDIAGLPLAIQSIDTLWKVLESTTNTRILPRERGMILPMNERPDSIRLWINLDLKDRLEEEGIFAINKMPYAMDPDFPVNVATLVTELLVGESEWPLRVKDPRVMLREWAPWKKTAVLGVDDILAQMRGYVIEEEAVIYEVERLFPSARGKSLSVRDAYDSRNDGRWAMRAKARESLGMPPKKESHRALPDLGDGEDED